MSTRCCRRSGPSYWVEFVAFSFGKPSASISSLIDALAIKLVLRRTKQRHKPDVRIILHSAAQELEFPARLTFYIEDCGWSFLISTSASRLLFSGIRSSCACNENEKIRNLLLYRQVNRLFRDLAVGGQRQLLGLQQNVCSLERRPGLFDRKTRDFDMKYRPPLSIFQTFPEVLRPS